MQAVMEGGLVKAVTFEDLQTGENVTIMAHYVLDATEEGDLLPLTGCESVVGAESAAITGEPHALDGPADPLDQQAITCARPWSGGRARITPLTSRKHTSSGEATGGRDRAALPHVRGRRVQRGPSSEPAGRTQQPGPAR
jgi:hypothetical protein